MKVPDESRCFSVSVSSLVWFLKLHQHTCISLIGPHLPKNLFQIELWRDGL
jgi:hypothetical protein